MTKSGSTAHPERIPRDGVPTCGAASSSSAGRGSTITRYVLVTAARNESKHLERVIQSVAAQTIRPLLWVIVSDASTDGTDEIVTKYALRFPWIKLLRMPEAGERHFGRKALCFNAGWRHARDLEFDVIANVDADVSFGPDYIAFLLQKFDAEPRLGVAGTPYCEGSYVAFSHRWADLEHVCGQFQMFRRTCLENIGGYLPMPQGGIDTVAVTTARMRGWRTKTFTGRSLVHHRKMGAGWKTEFRARFIQGRMEYVLGNHPTWQMLRVLDRMRRKPYVLGGLYLLLGYLCTCLQQPERPQGQDFVAFRRREQIRRLRSLLRTSLRA